MNKIKPLAVLPKLYVANIAGTSLNRNGFLGNLDFLSALLFIPSSNNKSVLLLVETQRYKKHAVSPPTDGPQKALATALSLLQLAPVLVS